MSEFFLVISETLLKRCFTNPKVKFLFIISIISNIRLVSNLGSHAVADVGFSFSRCAKWNWGFGGRS